MIVDRVQQALRVEELDGRYDRVLLVMSMLLAAFGLVMVASSSIAIAEGLAVEPLHFFVRHLVFLGGGGVIAVSLASTELRDLERHSRLLLLLGFSVLVLVFVPGVGREVNGAQRWLNLGVSSFQAVELSKLLLVVWLASYLARYREQVQTRWFGSLKPLGVVALMSLLLLAQPDFGSAVLLCAVTTGMIWLAGVRIAHILTPTAVGLAALWLLVRIEPYRMRRLNSFLDPWADPFRDGFQLTQALIAIGRGEWLGQGLGGSVQKLFYLPEAHTDFIFAVIGEELGFVGVLVVIVLISGIVARAFWLGLRGVEMGRGFAGFCAFGVALWLGLQSFVSMAVNLGMLPTKGLTLPLISSGGSSVLITTAALGLLLRVSFELDRSERQAVKHRADLTRPEPAEPTHENTELNVPAPSSRARLRIEPVLGELA